MLVGFSFKTWDASSDASQQKKLCNSKRCRKRDSKKVKNFSYLLFGWSTARNKSLKEKRTYYVESYNEKLKHATTTHSVSTHL